MPKCRVRRRPDWSLGLQAAADEELSMTCALAVVHLAAVAGAAAESEGLLVVFETSGTEAESVVQILLDDAEFPEELEVAVHSRGSYSQFSGESRLVEDSVVGSHNLVDPPVLATVEEGSALDGHLPRYD